MPEFQKWTIISSPELRSLDAEIVRFIELVKPVSYLWLFFSKAVKTTNKARTYQLLSAFWNWNFPGQSARPQLVNFNNTIHVNEYLKSHRISFPTSTIPIVSLPCKEAESKHSPVSNASPSTVLPARSLAYCPSAFAYAFSTSGTQSWNDINYVN